MKANIQDRDIEEQDEFEEHQDTGSMMREKEQHIRRRSNDSTVDTEIELESRFITPQATDEFPELTRDLRTSNLSDYDVDMAMRIGEILRYIDTIEKSYFNETDFDKSRRMFISDLQFIGNTRAAYKGFMSQLMRTQRMENVPSTEVKETYEHGASDNIMSVFNKVRGKGKKPPQVV